MLDRAWFHRFQRFQLLKLSCDEPLSDCYTNLAFSVNVRPYATVGAVGRMPLSCLALIHPPSGSGPGSSTDGSSSSSPALPTILAGSYDGSVYAYDADTGVVLGRGAARSLPFFTSTLAYLGNRNHL